MKIDGTYEVKTGWIDETNIYGFHKIQKRNVSTILKWVCTDLNSGLRVCSASTRKTCYEWVLRNQNRIEIQKNKKEYRKYLDRMKQL
jgi:hypothetical protein